MTRVPLAPARLRFAVLATDIALFSVRQGTLVVRLMRVHRPPRYKNTKSLPGGLLHPKETADEAARRLLGERAHIAAKEVYVEQLYTFSDVTRDPRNRVVSVAYLGLVPWEKLSDAERADTNEAWWAPLPHHGTLAYDHDEILQTALTRLSSRARYTTLLSRFMLDEFTLTELEETYRAVLRTALDKRNFRKKILKLDILTALKGKKRRGAFRPAQMYRFRNRNVVEIPPL